MIVWTATAIIAIVAIGGFAFLYAIAIYKVWCHGTEKPSHHTSYVYVATILAGLVGGVAAMVFNEELPRESVPAVGVPVALTPRTTGPGDSSVPTPTPTIHRPLTVRELGPRAGGTAFVRSISVFSKESLLAAMSAVYMLVYLLVGIAGIVTWVWFGDAYTSDLVKNVALISIGLFAAILRTFFRIP